MKKQFALVPDERAKECTEHQFRYTGRIPCTGQIVCSMCGAVGANVGGRLVPAVATTTTAGTSEGTITAGTAWQG